MEAICHMVLKFVTVFWYKNLVFWSKNLVYWCQKLIFIKFKNKDFQSPIPTSLDFWSRNLLSWSSARKYHTFITKVYLTVAGETTRSVRLHPLELDNSKTDFTALRKLHDNFISLVKDNKCGRGLRAFLNSPAGKTYFHNNKKSRG